MVSHRGAREGPASPLPGRPVPSADTRGATFVGERGAGRRLRCRAVGGCGSMGLWRWMAGTVCRNEEIICRNRKRCGDARRSTAVMFTIRTGETGRGKSPRARLLKTSRIHGNARCAGGRKSVFGLWRGRVPSEKRRVRCPRGNSHTVSMPVCAAARGRTAPWLAPEGSPLPPGGDEVLLRSISGVR